MLPSNLRICFAAFDFSLFYKNNFLQGGRNLSPGQQGLKLQLVQPKDSLSCMTLNHKSSIVISRLPISC